MLKIDRDLEALGGIASTAELLRRGHSAELIWLWSEYGHMLRVRKGWYASHDVPSDAIRALRVGGRLTCVSAAAYYGIIDGPVSTLHVAVASSASRLRTSRDHRAGLARSPEPGLIVHWGPRSLDGTRIAVSPTECLRQLQLCPHAEAKSAALIAMANRYP